MQVGDDFLAGDLGALIEHRDRADGGGLGALFDVQRILAQDPLVQVAQGLAGVDSEIVGEGRFHAPVGGQRVGLAVGEVVRRDQLGPQRLTVGVLGGQGLEFGDDEWGTPASDFGFRLGGVDENLVLDERGRKGVDELKVTQVLEHRPAPLR